MQAITPFDTADDHAASIRRAIALLARCAPKLLLENARALQSARATMRRAAARGAVAFVQPAAPTRHPGGRPECPKLQAAVTAWIGLYGLDGPAPIGALKRHCAWHRVNRWSFSNALMRQRRAAP